jgi:ribosome-binding protein aMBF1 (putative translation factor)
MSKATTKNKASRKKLRKFIPVEEAIARWRRDPEYVKEYDALEEEFALVSEIIRARAAAGLTQAELAKRMKSTRTLKRFAAATGHKLKIRFEPSNA